MSGRILVLNGAACSGKTSIARTIQQKMSEPWLHLGLETVLVNLSSKYNSVFPPRLDGLVWYVDMKDSRTIVDAKVGPVAHQVISSMHRAFAAIAASGTNLIIEHAFFEPTWLAECVELLGGCDVVFAGIKCPPDILRQRELAKASEGLLFSGFHSGRVHQHDLYDVEVDTSLLTMDQSAARVIETLYNPPSPRAFDRLRERLAADPLAKFGQRDSRSPIRTANLPPTG